MTTAEFRTLKVGDEISLIGSKIRNTVMRVFPSGSVRVDQHGYSLVVEIGDCERMERSHEPTKGSTARKHNAPYAGYKPGKAKGIPT